MKPTVPRAGKGLLFFMLSAPFFLFLAADDVIPRADGGDVKIVLFPLKKAVISSQVESKITEYKFKEGEVFAKGDTIVKFDSELYLQEHEKARTLFDYCETVYKQSAELFSKGALGTQDFGKIKADYESSSATMKIAEIRLESCDIAAPFSGRLVKKISQEHETVKAGQPVMEIIDDHELLAVMHLPSTDTGKIRLGMEMKFRIDEIGSVCAGKVTEISANINPGSRTFEVKAVIDNTSRTIWAGMSGVMVR
jgi:RND family efflux transporter MFP subunit